MLYEFSIYKFGEKEIEQIRKMVQDYYLGEFGPIDRRRITYQVFQWAKGWELIIPGDQTADYRGKFPFWVKNKKRFYFNTDLQLFNVIHHMPVEALWRMVQPMIEKRKGYSIISLEEWKTLGLWPSKNRWHSKNDFQQMREILQKLDSCGYIYFQEGGSLWDITIRKR